MVKTTDCTRSLSSANQQCAKGNSPLLQLQLTSRQLLLKWKCLRPASVLIIHRYIDHLVENFFFFFEVSFPRVNTQTSALQVQLAAHGMSSYSDHVVSNPNRKQHFTGFLLGKHVIIHSSLHCTNNCESDSLRSAFYNYTSS